MEGPRRVAEDILRDAGVDYADLRPFESGSQHHLFRLTLDGAPFVLKVGRVDQPFGDSWDPNRSHLDGLRTEAAAIEFACHITTPSPTRILCEDPPAAIQPHIPGESGQALWDRGRLDTAYLRDVCYAMGYALAGIHTKKRRDTPGVIPELPRREFDVKGARLLHMDFHLGNVQLVHDRRRGSFKVSGVVDWVLARWGPREADLVEMHLSVFRSVPGSRDAFMGGYRRAGGLPLDTKLMNRFLMRELIRRLELGGLDPAVEADWEKWTQELRKA
ncbi:MAG: phosphotransferase [Proteobacteria bacterium]|nr:phosphotransferase [Pseudomonadota bacterium]MCP4915301.1 phosphotransferase [Pseudomonadota bacterium]